MPIFARKAVSGPEPEALVTMTYDPDTDSVAVDCLLQESNHEDIGR